MDPRNLWRESASGVEQVRARLLTALHLGQHKPGDRAPSIRRMAVLAGLNHKTVHRAYVQFAKEGLLDMRWGSGTFFSESRLQTPSHNPLVGALLEVVERCRVEADHLGVAPDVFLRFLGLIMGGRLRGTVVAVAECNREQIGLIERELRGALGVSTRELLISDIVAHHPSALAGVRAVVTTDCHRAEVTEMIVPTGIPVYRVALAPAFTQTLLRRARQGPVVMVVRDPTYGKVFLRMLRQLQVPREVLDRFEVVGGEELRSRKRGLPPTGSLYVSPLVSDLDFSSHRGLRRIKPQPYLAATSVEAVKVQLALQLAAREGRA